MDAKKKTVIERIQSHKEALAKAQEYLETGAHSNWHGFRATFTPKLQNGQVIPPHKSWVANVFIPKYKKAIRDDERKLDRLDIKRRA